MLFKMWEKVKQCLQNYYLDYFIVFVLALLLFSWLQGSFAIGGPDSFYHAKITQFISKGQILHQLPWLQETSLAQQFVDHHFLYHLFLVPFVILDDPLVGTKIATIILVSLSVLTIYWLLKKFKVSFPIIYILFLLLVSHSWLFRVSLVKVPVVFLIFLFLAFYYLTKKKWLSLFLVSFLSVWLYAGWPILIFMAAVYSVASLVMRGLKTEDSVKQKIKSIFKLKQSFILWKGLGIIFSGIVAGLVINPYFPANLSFYWTQIVKIAIVNYQNVIRVGNEWYPFGFYNLITNNFLICALLIVGIILFILTYKKQSTVSLTWGVMALTFFALTLKANRNIEYFIPFTIIFFAFCFSDYLRSHYQIELKEVFRIRPPTFSLVLILILGFTFILMMPREIATAKKHLLKSFPINSYQEVSLWLKENTPERTTIFNANWGRFPFLFYYNDHNYYLTGLDPTFMYEKNKDKYWLHRYIITGNVQDDLHKVIKDNFNTDYVIVENVLVKLDEIISSSDFFKKVYEDEEVKVYQILNNE